MRRSFVTLVALVLSVGRSAFAASPDATYAVVSLVGDRMTVVGRQAGTGSNLDQNRQLELPLTDDHFDRFASRIAIAAIRRARSDALVEEVVVPDRTPIGDASDLSGLLDNVRPLIRREDTHFLVVVSKSVGQAHMRTSNGFVGSGTLAGLGFYLDESRRLRNGATGERGYGYIAPYAYIQVSLVDLRSGAVVRSETTDETSTIANTAGALDPWETLTAEQKVRSLDAVLGRAVRRAMPTLLAAP